MKRTILFLALIALCVSLIGCAAGAATAGYSVRAGSADDLNSKTRKAIIDEAVERAFDKCKTYIDAVLANKGE